MLTMLVMQKNHISCAYSLLTSQSIACSFVQLPVTKNFCPVGHCPACTNAPSSAVPMLCLEQATLQHHAESQNTLAEITNTCRHSSSTSSRCNCVASKAHMHTQVHIACCKQRHTQLPGQPKQQARLLQHLQDSPTHHAYPKIHLLPTKT